MDREVKLKRRNFINNEVIMHRRLELGWSQRKLSKISGVPQSVISRFEAGANGTEWSVVRELADHLGFDLILRAYSADFWNKLNAK